MNKQQYLHAKAIKALESTLPVVVVIAGRGWSKSTLVGADIYTSAIQMPRSLGALWGVTYVQILTKILPSAKKLLLEIGLKEDRPGQPGHFCIARKPPPYFQRPRNEPLRWETVLTFMNGSALEFISIDNPNTTAGGSYDYMIWDEAVFFDKEVHDQKCIPSLRGNVRYYHNCSRHGRRLYVSSQAWSPHQYWVEDQKYLKDEEGDLVIENEERVMDPEVEFIHGTSYDNEAILGKKFFERQKRTLTKTAFDIEIMAKRGEKISEAFYEEFDVKKHTYTKSIEYGYNYEENEFGVFVKQMDTDRDTRISLKLSFDFGTKFNSLIVAQDQRAENEVRILNVFFESNNKLIENLVDPFIKTYQNHSQKTVELFGDPSGNKVGHMDKMSLFGKIQLRLSKAGWRVVNRMQGRAYPLHRIKHQFINDCLKEENLVYPKIRINYHRCKHLLTSIQNAPMGKGGQKKKTSERQNIPQETATHLSDAFDYLLFYGYFRSPAGASSGGGVRFGGR